MHDWDQAKERELFELVQVARHEYLCVSDAFDRLNLEVRNASHGMISPDGLQAIANLNTSLKIAFEKYQRALNAYASAVLAGRRSSSE